MIQKIRTGRRTSSKTISQKVLPSLTLKGEILEAEPDGFVLLQTDWKQAGQFQSRTLHVEGKWELSPQRSLCFRMKYSDELIELKGSWQIGPRGELVYTYSREKMITGTLVFQTLVFRGRWDLTPDLRLDFALEGSGTVFRFEGRLSRFETIRGHGRIHYQLGVGIQKDLKRRRDTLILFGRWRPLSSVELGFEVEAEEGAPYLLKLRGSYQFGSKNQIAFILTSPKGRKIPELSLVLSRKIARNSEIFLKVATDFEKESFVGVGGRLTW